MTTYFLRHRTRGFRLPFPFRSEQEAERHRQRIDDDNEYAVYAISERAAESEEDRLQREDREFEDRLLEHFIDTGGDAVQL